MLIQLSNLFYGLLYLRIKMFIKFRFTLFCIFVILSKPNSFIDCLMVHSFLFKSNLIMTRCVIAIGQRLHLTVDANCSRLYPRFQIIINTPYQNQMWLSIIVVIVNLVLLLDTILIVLIIYKKEIQNSCYE